MTMNLVNPAADLWQEKRAFQFSCRHTGTMITSEDITGPVANLEPLNVQFNSEGSLCTFLYPDKKSGARQVQACSPSSGFEVSKLIDTSFMNKTLELEEQLRRERMRMFVTGVSTYEWCVRPDDCAEYMMIPMSGSVLLYEKETQQLRCVYDGSMGAAIDPHVSPAVDSVAFIIGRDLYIQHLNTRKVFAGEPPSDPMASVCQAPMRLTKSGDEPGVSCGVADYVAQEEMDRYRGFWFSPDGKQIAYTKADESGVAEYDIAHFYDDNPLRKETHRYPFAGTTNPSVKLAVLKVPPPSDSDVASECEATSVWMDLTESSWDEYYLARVDWWPDGSVMAQVEDRRQRELQLLRLDPVTGAREVLVRESCHEVWINLHDLWKPLLLRDIEPNDASEGFAFVWGSERSGFMQLYVYMYRPGGDVGASLLSEVPIGGGGSWVVDTLVCVDAPRNRVFFSGNKDDPRHMHLYCAPLLDHQNTSPLIQVTKGDGWHRCTVSSCSNFYCDIFSQKNAPSRTEMRRLPFIPDWTATAVGADIQDYPAEESHVLVDAATADVRYANLKNALRPPVLGCVPTEGGIPLMVAAYIPPGVDAVWSSGKLVQKGADAMPLPCVVAVYGGPHVQRVQNKWTLTVDMRAQRLAERGYVVIKCDNRGSSRRGLAFEGAVRGDMGNLEVVDQATAVEFFSSSRGLAANEVPLVDASRVGIYGWSYGGYLSSMALCRAPNVFRAGIAGAPVTHWDAYDTHYTERYMGLPDENKIGYERSAVMTHASGIQGRLMLVHGLIDENVHFRHTARLIQKLNSQFTQYDLVLFPSERHSPHKVSDRIYLEDRILEFFERELKDNASAPGASGATSTSEARGGRVGDSPAQARL